MAAQYMENAWSEFQPITQEVRNENTWDMMETWSASMEDNDIRAWELQASLLAESDDMRKRQTESLLQPWNETQPITPEMVRTLKRRQKIV